VRLRSASACFLLAIASRVHGWFVSSRHVVNQNPSQRNRQVHPELRAEAVFSRTRTCSCWQHASICVSPRSGSNAPECMRQAGIGFIAAGASAAAAAWQYSGAQGPERASVKALARFCTAVLLYHLAFQHPGQSCEPTGIATSFVFLLRDLSAQRQLLQRDCL
jgi:hypothetical protein